MIRTPACHGPSVVLSWSAHQPVTVRPLYCHDPHTSLSRSVHCIVMIRTPAYHGPSVVLSWSVRHPAIVFNNQRSFMVRPLCYHDPSVTMSCMIRPSSCHDPSVVMPWSVRHHAMIRPSSCHDASVVMPWSFMPWTPPFMQLWSAGHTITNVVVANHPITLWRQLVQVSSNQCPCYWRETMGHRERCFLPSTMLMWSHAITTGNTSQMSNGYPPVHSNASRPSWITWHT